MPLTLTRSLPFVVTIDGEPIHLSLRRMTMDEFIPFETAFVAYGRGRKHTPDPTDAVSGDDFHARVGEHVATGRHYAAWLCDVFEAYVTVRAGDLTVDNEIITSGRRFVEVLARYGDVVSTVLAELYLRNKLSEDQKKLLASRRASAPSSTDAPPIAGNGPAPAMTAGSAAPSSSAPAAAATGPSSDASSGTMGHSSSGPAPFEA